MKAAGIRGAVSTSQVDRMDRVDRMWRVVIVAGFIVSVLVFLAAPALAIPWSRLPFTGFLVEQTLVIEPIASPSWTGPTEGIVYPQRVVRMAGQALADGRQYNALLGTLAVGDRVPIFTEEKKGNERLFPRVELAEFPHGDLFRLFWLPYLVGLVYLGIGAWIYRVRGYTRPGRALAVFCIVTALTSGLIFDLYTTHVLTLVWIVAVAQIGAVLIGLAWRFPEEWGPVTRRSWITVIPFAISMGLTVWAVVSQNNPNDPWAYLPARQYSFRWAAVGILVFFAVMLYRARRGSSPVVRRQARLVTIGAIIAFSPVMVWLIAPLFGVSANFDPAVFLPPLLIFPVSVGLAILRYRLWEVDTLVNQAFVYGMLTAILAGVFAALSAFTQRLFLAITGEQSDIAIVITTLLVASFFAPVKSWVEGFVSHQFHDARDQLKDLRAYGDQVKAYVQMTDATQLSRRLLAEAVTSLRAQSGAIFVEENGALVPAHTVGPWRNDPYLSVPLSCGEHRHGLLQLGPPLPDQGYDRQEAEALLAVADQIARAICLAQRT